LRGADQSRFIDFGLRLSSKRGYRLPMSAQVGPFPVRELFGRSTHGNVSRPYTYAEIHTKFPNVEVYRHLHCETVPRSGPRRSLL
jgi:hypothetical protein